MDNPDLASGAPGSGIIAVIGNAMLKLYLVCLDRASDFFQDWWAKVTHGAKKCGSFSEMMGPSISN